jgi:hypothetical protein
VAAKTRLCLDGYGGKRCGSFAGKTVAATGDDTVRLDARERLLTTQARDRTYTVNARNKT